MSLETGGELIRKLRTVQGMSQQELAEQSSLSLRTIQRIENGESEARGDSLKRIAKVLGVEVKELLPVQNEDLHRGQKESYPPDQVSHSVSSDRFVGTKDPDKSSLKEDRGLIFLLKLSPLAYLFFPLLAIAAPFLIGKLFEHRVAGMKEERRKVMSSQLLWIGILAIAIGYVFISKTFMLQLPMPVRELNIYYTGLIFYYANAVFVVLSAVGWLVFGSKKKNRLEFG